ncbi:MAG: hypothetical protein K8T91_16210 [Planctomycetes bacterium]|nr:hypothetical protein [Planctomycetota bacterium]
MKPDLRTAWRALVADDFLRGLTPCGSPLGDLPRRQQGEPPVVGTGGSLFYRTKLSD